MAWSYDETDLNTTTLSGRLNTVRLLLGDTDTNDQQVKNEEITFALDQSNNNVYFAAAWCARTIASQYARKVNTQLDGALSADYSDLSNQYSKLAENLEYQGKKVSATLGVKAGGLTKSGVEAVRGNTNRIEPSFRRDRFRNPPDYNTDDTDYA
jgi:phosphoribosylformylglycinamidine (FGAM) synthase-like enzyme